MADLHEVIFYPVGNGDTTQIILSTGKRVLFDFCHRDKAEDPNTPEIDLKKRLKSDLDAAQRDYFDVVAFTHADNDHIQGSTEFFELQHAKIYHGDDRIKIRELWVPAAMLLEEADRDHQQEEFVILRQEARHRLLQGKDILVFSKPDKLLEWLVPHLEARGEAPNARDHLFIDAGQLVPGFNLFTDKVEFFCHSPFIEHCDDGDIVRNSAALVFNVRFNADGSLFDYLEVGDAEYQDLEDIVKASKAHGNEDRLKWDLFNIPHHCSYKSLNAEGEKGARETIPTPLVTELLLKGQEQSYIVSCSNPIPELPISYSAVQPPHIQAKNCYVRYLKEVSGRKFLVTMEEPNAYHPEPISFEVSSSGLSIKPIETVGALSLGSIAPPRAG